MTPALSLRVIDAQLPIAMLIQKNLSSILKSRPPANRSITCASSAQPPAPGAAKYVVNMIPNNGSGKHTTDGVPAVMGVHLMASGFVAPVSTSKGAGLDVYPPEVAYYQKPGDNTQVMLHATAAAASNTLAKLAFEASEAAIKAKGSFTLVLAGGSLPASLSGLLTYKGGAVQWDKFYIFFVDERNVPHDHPDSNFKATNDALLSKVPIPANQVFGILENVPVRDAAVHYEGMLIGLPTSVLPRDAKGFPVFDLMLLGLGPDGHVASLFPHRSSLTETTKWMLPIDNSPKPPPERITMTLPVINAAKEVVFVALGEGKAEVVQRALEVQALPGALPAQLVRPDTGRVRWLLDVQSAQTLDIANWDDMKMWPRSQFPKPV